MKILKFRAELVPLVLSGQKTSTWRLFDDKDLGKGDEIELRVFGTKELFAHGVITEVVEKPFGNLTPEDFDGHNEYESDEAMYRTFSGYYKRSVGPSTPVKIIRFKLS